jgi:uncharacterized protein (TIGR02246 family)
MDPTAAEHVHRIRALDAQWLAAAARRDLDGMMVIYAPDARELLPDMPPLIGTTAIRGFYATLMEEMPRFAHHFEAQEITVGAAGDLAVVRGTYRFTPDVQVPGQVHSGKFVGVWRRLGADWRLAINISNSDPPVSPPAAA